MTIKPTMHNADEMETNPVNKACITATNDVIVTKLARLEILVFALNNYEIRYTHLRSTK